MKVTDKPEMLDVTTDRLTLTAHKNGKCFLASSNLIGCIYVISWTQDTQVFISMPGNKVVFTKYQVVALTTSEKLIPGFTHVCQASGMQSLKAIQCFVLYTFSHFHFPHCFFRYLHILSWTAVALQLNCSFLNLHFFS